MATDGDGAFPTRCVTSWQPTPATAGGGAAASAPPRAAANVVALAAHVLADDTVLTVAATAAKTIVITLLKRHDDGSGWGVAALPPPVTLAVAAPALCIALAPRSGDDDDSDAPAPTTAVTAYTGHMDGGLSVVHIRLPTADSGLTAEVAAQLAPHSKYVSRVALSPCGRYLVTASHDRSLSLFRVAPETDAPQLMQRLYFRGAVLAAAWWRTTVVVAVAGMPVLYYLTVADLTTHATEVDALSATPLPLPPPPADAAHVVAPTLLLHRVPLSEDAVRVRVLLPGRADHADAIDVPASATLPSDAPLPVFGEDGDAIPTGGDIAEGGFYLPVGFAVVDLAVSGGSGGGAPQLAAAADNGVVYVFEWGTNVLAARLVGHNVSPGGLLAHTRIAWRPGGDHQYLAATSERDYAVVVYSVPSTRCLARLGVGQPVASAASAAAASSAAATSDSRYGHHLAAGAAADATSRQTAGHTGTIKEVVWLAPHLLLTAAFDKSVAAWA